MSDELGSETGMFEPATVCGAGSNSLLSTHNSSLFDLIWPDSGLTRNTRALGYRCSVPGLAGFTGAALCGARSLITCQKRFRS